MAAPSAPPVDRWWDAALHTVLADPSRLRPAFQPIFDLRHGTVAGFEMLARFGGGPSGATPLDWLAAARDRGLSDRLEAALIATGLASREALPPNTFLALNAGPEALLSPEVQSVLRDRDLENVVVEITETVPVADYERLGAALDRLRDAGAHVAVDDAGAGYASLQHVLRLKPAFVKLDRELVADIDRDAAKLALVEAMGALASRLDAWIVAEGVERPQEREVLAALGVPLAQGFGLARPGSELAAGLRVPSARRRGAGVAAIARREAPTVTLDQLDRLLVGGAAGSEATVVLDDRARAFGLVVGTEAGGWRLKRDPLVALPGERPDVVARRAMTRAAADRFDPICCCDETGRFVGLIAVDHLVHVLAHRTREATP